MAAVPASFCPIPFTLFSLVALTLVLGGSVCAPVFVAVFVAYLTNCGLGIIQGILARQAHGEVPLETPTGSESRS